MRVLIDTPTSKDILAMEVRRYQRDQKDVMLPLLESGELDSILKESAHMVRVDGVPVAAWGAVVHWPGVATAFAFVTDDVWHVRHYVQRQILKDILYLAKKDELARMEAAVNSEDKQAVRWALHFGFQIEGIMRRYGPSGEDYLMMARLF